MKADFKKWNSAEKWRLWEAACLWEEMEPPNTFQDFMGMLPHHPELCVKYLQLVEAVRNGELKPIMEEGG